MSDGMLVAYSSLFTATKLSISLLALASPNRPPSTSRRGPGSDILRGPAEMDPTAEMGPSPQSHSQWHDLR